MAERKNTGGFISVLKKNFSIVMCIGVGEVGNTEIVCNLKTVF